MKNLPIRYFARMPGGSEVFIFRSDYKSKNRKGSFFPFLQKIFPSKILSGSFFLASLMYKNTNCLQWVMYIFKAQIGSRWNGFANFVHKQWCLNSVDSTLSRRVSPCRCRRKLLCKCSSNSDSKCSLNTVQYRMGHEKSFQRRIFMKHIRLSWKIFQKSVFWQMFLKNSKMIP